MVIAAVGEQGTIHVHDVRTHPSDHPPAALVLRRSPPRAQRLRVPLAGERLAGKTFEQRLRAGPDIEVTQLVTVWLDR